MVIRPVPDFSDEQFSPAKLGCREQPEAGIVHATRRGRGTLKFQSPAGGDKETGHGRLKDDGISIASQHGQCFLLCRTLFLVPVPTTMPAMPQWHRLTLTPRRNNSGQYGAWIAQSKLSSLDVLVGHLPLHHSDILNGRTVMSCLFSMWLSHTPSWEKSPHYFVPSLSNHTPRSI